MNYNKERLYEQLKADEGVVYEVYLDHLGNKTFGVGHLIVRDDPEFKKPVGGRVSQDRVWQAFEQDLNNSIVECVFLYGSDFNRWPGEVQEVLINMMFNLGRVRLSKFVKMRAALMKRDWRKAAEEGRDSLWYRQVPNRAERLMSRLERV
jgi:lysozyme